MLHSIIKLRRGIQTASFQMKSKRFYTQLDFWKRDTNLWEEPDKMKNQTKLICIGIILMVLLTGLILNAVFEDEEGPLIYEVDILPIEPVAGDVISIVMYCIDRSGVSHAQLSSSLNGIDWNVQEMSFYSCLCIAGGRWVGTFGPVSEGDNAQFLVTAFDRAARQNSADTQIFYIELIAT